MGFLLLLPPPKEFISLILLDIWEGERGRSGEIGWNPPSLCEGGGDIIFPSLSLSHSSSSPSFFFHTQRRSGTVDLRYVNIIIRQ